MLTIGSSGSGKTNALLNLINNQPDIDIIYIYTYIYIHIYIYIYIYTYGIDPYETKYHYLTNMRGKVGFIHYDDPKAFIEYSNDMQDV